MSWLPNFMEPISKPACRIAIFLSNELNLHLFWQGHIWQLFLCSNINMLCVRIYHGQKICLNRVIRNWSLWVQEYLLLVLHWFLRCLWRVLVAWSAFLLNCIIIKITPCLCFPEQFELVVSSFSASEISRQQVLSDISALPYPPNKRKTQVTWGKKLTTT